MRSLLWLSDGPSLLTGFAKVSREILRRLATTGEFECTWGAWFEDRPVEQWDGLPLRVYPCGPKYGRDCFEALLAAGQPDVVVAAGDLWMIQWMEAFRRGLSVPLLGYCPLDAYHPRFVPATAKRQAGPVNVLWEGMRYVHGAAARTEGRSHRRVVGAGDARCPLHGSRGAGRRPRSDWLHPMPLPCR